MNRDTTITPEEDGVVSDGFNIEGDGGIKSGLKLGGGISGSYVSGSYVVPKPV